ncbi:methyltransferase [Nocardia alni]|uniref:methyltransferase n=1 Tax=Nocardia alni TaxID=2815723 RepID=UPI001C238752|nr:methyltransferase [Nocardia alni]
MSTDNAGIARILNIFTRSLSGYVLIAADQSGLIPFLAAHPEGLTIEELARERSFEPRLTALVLHVLGHLELVEAHGDRFRATEVAARHLDPSKPAYCGGWLNFLYAGREFSFGKLGEYLTAGSAPAPQSNYDENTDILRFMMSAWGPIGTAAADAFVRRTDLSGARRILDLGAGNGAFTIAALSAVPEATATAIDLPYQVEALQAHVDAAGLSDRVEVVAGDVLEGDLPSGYDTVFLNNVLHAWDPSRYAKALASCAAALRPGGTIHIREHMLDGFGPEHRVEPALTALGIVTTGGQGGATDVGDFRNLLHESGFGEVTVEPLPDQPDCSHLITGRRL